MSLDAIIAAYVILLLAGLFALTLYDWQRERRFGPTPSDDRIFRCGRCSFVYTDDPDVDRSRCPQCGTLNEAIKF
jgi:hypothetical protein